MPQNTNVNRRIVLNARPRGAPTAEDFRFENDPVPKPEAGQVLAQFVVEVQGQNARQSLVLFQKVLGDIVESRMQRPQRQQRRRQRPDPDQQGYAPANTVRAS